VEEVEGVTSEGRLQAAVEVEAAAVEVEAAAVEVEAAAVEVEAAAGGEGDSTDRES